MFSLDQKFIQAKQQNCLNLFFCLNNLVQKTKRKKLLHQYFNFSYTVLYIEETQILIYSLPFYHLIKINLILKFKKLQNKLSVSRKSLLLFKNKVLFLLTT